jgi:hypothetical protein
MAVTDPAPAALREYLRRAERALRRGRFSDAYAAYYRGITAHVLPVHRDVAETIYSGYASRLANRSPSKADLADAAFAHWAFSDYAGAVALLDKLLEHDPANLFATLFRGSSLVLGGLDHRRGLADLERAIALDPDSPDVRYVVADAYTYGAPNADRAFLEATLAFSRGLRTPRVHAILAFGRLARGEDRPAAAHIAAHIELVTTERLTAEPLAAGGSLSLDVVPGRVYHIPVPAVARTTISVSTSSDDFSDSIAVLLDPDGVPVAGSDDENESFAAIDCAAMVTGTFQLLATSFEAVDTGVLRVSRAGDGSI